MNQKYSSTRILRVFPFYLFNNTPIHYDTIPKESVVSVPS